MFPLAVSGYEMRVLTGKFRFQKTILGPRIFVEEALLVDTPTGYKADGRYVWRKAENDDLSKLTNFIDWDRFPG